MGEEVSSPKADLVLGKIPVEQLPTITASMVAADVATQSELDAVAANKASLVSGKVPVGEIPVITAAMVAADVTTQSELDTVVNALPIIKKKRVTTGVIAGLTTTDVTVTWPTPFDNANYTVVASLLLDEAGDSLIIRRVRSKLAASCVVLVQNQAVSSKTGEIQAIAIAD